MHSTCMGALVSNHSDATESVNTIATVHLATISVIVSSQPFDGSFGPDHENVRHLFYLSSLYSSSFRAHISFVDLHVTSTLRGSGK